MPKSKYSMEDKRQEASSIYDRIMSCKTEEEIYEISDYLDDCMLAGYIFKKDYKWLSDELDDQLMTIIEEGFRS